MADTRKQEPVTLQELLISSLAMTDALAKLLIEKGIISQEEFTGKLSEERAAYQKLFSRRAIDGRLTDRKKTFLLAHLHWNV